MTEKKQNTETNSKIAELVDNFQFLVGSNSGIGLVCKTIFKKYADMDFDEYVKMETKPKLEQTISLEDFLKVCYALTNEIVKEGEKVQNELQSLLNQKPEKKESKIILG